MEATHQPVGPTTMPSQLQTNDFDDGEDYNLRKREMFAVSLRKKSKAKILQQRREQLFQRMQRHNATIITPSSTTRGNGHEHNEKDNFATCKKSLEKLETLLRMNAHANVLDALKEFYNDVSQAYCCEGEQCTSNEQG